MFKTLCRIAVVVLFCAFLLWLVGSSFSKFAQQIELKDPLEVFNISVPPIEEPENPISLPEVIAEESNSSNTEISIPEESNSSEVIVEEGLTKEALNTLISNIRVSTENQPNKYERDDFEKPVRTYKLNGQTYSRNKYAWHISEWLISEEPFEYLCPYTGITITDPSKLDLDHIIALSYVFKYGDTNWTKEQMNQYAYDQLIGVDVLNSSNRSKSDKGPSDWLPEINIGSYCYTWLKISEEYDIALRQIDIQVCKLEILNAMSAGEKITLINPFIEESEEHKLQQEWLNETP